MVDTYIGKHRKMRCAEVLMSVITNPTRTDPWGAVTYQNIMNARRLLRKSDTRARRLCADARDLIQREVVFDKLAVGPLASLIKLLLSIGIERVNFWQGSITIHSPQGYSIDLLHPSKKAVNAVLEPLVRWSVIKDFS